MALRGGMRPQQATSVDSPFGGAPNPYARDKYYASSDARTSAGSEAQALREALRRAPVADAIVDALLHSGADAVSLARAGDDRLANAIAGAVPALCAMCRDAACALPGPSSTEAAPPPPPPSLPMSTMSPPRYGSAGSAAANVAGGAATPSGAAARRQREQSSSVSFGGYGQDTEPDDVGVRRPRRSDAGQPNAMPQARSGDSYGNASAGPRGAATATPYARRQREQASSVSFGGTGDEGGPSLREQAAQRKKQAGLREQAAINDHARAVFLENQRLAQQVKARTETLELSKGLGAAMGFDDDGDDRRGDGDGRTGADARVRQRPQAREQAEQAQAQALHAAYLENQEIALRAKHRAEQQELAERGLADVMGLAEEPTGADSARAGTGAAGSTESLAQRKAKKQAEAAAEHERLLAAERERTRLQRAAAAQRLRRGSGGPQSAVADDDRPGDGGEHAPSGQGASLRDYMQARGSAGSAPDSVSGGASLEPGAEPEPEPATETFAERKARKRAEAAAEHERLLAEERARMHQAHEARRQSFSGETHHGAVGLGSPQVSGDGGGDGGFSDANAAEAAVEGGAVDEESLPPPPGTPVCNDRQGATATEGDNVGTHRAGESFAERKARRQAEQAAAQEKLLAEERERMYRERVQMQQRRGTSGDPDDRAI